MERCCDIPSFPRINILGVGVHAINMDEAVTCLDQLAEKGKTGYVCVTGVHGIMESQNDGDLLNIHNQSLLTVPDGMPTVWLGRLQRFRTMSRVYGPDLMLEVCRKSVDSRRTHFLFGGKPGVAEVLKQELEKRFPGIRIVGTMSPPFRPMTDEEMNTLASEVNGLSPDYFWVGLGTPKQEKFMGNGENSLSTIMLGVGAAFDIHTGNLKDAPDWIKQLGLQWLFRLFQEPRRLWRRYYINNPLFVWRCLLQFIGIRKYPLPEHSKDK